MGGVVGAVCELWARRPVVLLLAPTQAAGPRHFPPARHFPRPGATSLSPPLARPSLARHAPPRRRVPRSHALSHTR